MSCLKSIVCIKLMTLHSLFDTLRRVVSVSSKKIRKNYPRGFSVALARSNSWNNQYAMV